MAIVSDAIMAMVSLGYTRPEAEKAVNSASGNIDVSDGVESTHQRSFKPHIIY